MTDDPVTLALPIPEGATHRYRRQDGSMTWAKNYRTDGMRFRAKVWSVAANRWEPSGKIILVRLLPLHEPTMVPEV